MPGFRSGSTFVNVSDEMLRFRSGSSFDGFHGKPGGCEVLWTVRWRAERCASVFPHAGIHIRVRVEAAREIENPLETEPRKRVGHMRAPRPVVAYDDHLGLGFEFRNAPGNLPHRNMPRTLDARNVELPPLSNIEEERGFPRIETLPQFPRRHVLIVRQNMFLSVFPSETLAKNPPSATSSVG